MAKRWWKSGHLTADEKVVERGSILTLDRQWKLKMLINGLGSISTLVVMFVFAATKFKDGAWIIIILIPAVVAIFSSIHHHYKVLANRLTLENYNTPMRISHNRVVLLIAGVHRGTLAALAYARSLSADVTAVHVSIDPLESQKVVDKWNAYGEGTRLVVLDSPYRLFIEPLMAFIEALLKNRQPTEVLTIVVPQFVTPHWWENLLHNQTALMLRFALLFKQGLVILEVPYNV